MTEALLLDRTREWADGWLIPTLERAGLIGPVEVEHLEAMGAESAWQACLAAGVATDDELARLVAGRFRLPLANLTAVASSAAAYLPGDVAVRYRAVPMRLDERVLDIASDRPADLDLERAVSFVAGRWVRVNFASPAAIDAALARLYPGQFVSAAVERLTRGLSHATAA